MVYRLSTTKNWQQRPIFLRLLLVFSVPTALILYTIFAYLLECGWMFSSVTAVLVGLSEAVVMAGPLRAYFRRLQKIGTWFVTVTEAGIYLETPQSGIRNYISWGRVEKVMDRRDVIMVALKNGLSYLMPTETLSAERKQELLCYCAARAGRQVAAERQMLPPAECCIESPVLLTGTRAQRLEFADALARQNSLTSQVRLLAICLLSSACVAMLLAPEPLEHMCWLAVALVCIILGVRGYLHPGRGIRKVAEDDSPCRVHVTREHVLLENPSASWSVVPLAQVESGLLMKHCITYTVKTGGMFLLNADTPIPAGIPLPRKRECWRTLLPLFVALVLIPGLVGIWAWPTDGRDEYVAARECGVELQAYLEELLPPTEYPGAIDWCALYIEESDGSCILSIDWESGLELFIELPPMESLQTDAD